MMRPRVRSTGSSTRSRASAFTSSRSTPTKSKLSDVGEWFAKKYQEKYNEPPIYAALNAFANALVFAQAIEMAKTTEPKAMIKALETGSFKGWSSVPVTFPQAEGSLWHNWSPPLMILKYTKAGADAVRGRGRPYARRELNEADASLLGASRQSQDRERELGADDVQHRAPDPDADLRA